MENTFPSDYDDALLLIHEDVLIQILVWLPIKSLLRFKSVNKSWRALIESSFFIHLHATLTTTTSSNKFGTFIFQTSPYRPHNNFYTKAADFFMLSSSSSRSDDGDEVVVEVEDLELPPLSNLVPSTRHPKLLMVGSCNGIVCLHDSSLGDVSLWNPATRQFRILPTSLSVKDIDRPHEYHDFVGFGFDVKTKDYKVVKITFCEDYILGVQVYSLSTDSWRLLEGGGSGLNPLFAKQVQEMNMEHGLYLNGSYFFEGINHQDEQIDHLMISFDFTQEIFTTMQFPDECDPDSDSTLIAITTYLGENMALLTKVESSSTPGDHDYDIWVLNEHHDGSSGSGRLNKESCWTKLQQHLIQMKRRSGIVSQTTIPRGISNDGEFAFIETRNSCFSLKSTNKLQLFNLVTKEASIELLMGKELQRADVYNPSLVSINGGNGATTADSQ